MYRRPQFNVQVKRAGPIASATFFDDFQTDAVKHGVQ